MKIVAIKDIKKSEVPWLECDITAGEEFYRYTGHTYGCVSYDGVAVTRIKNECPFFELPNDSVKAKADDSTGR